MFDLLTTDGLTYTVKRDGQTLGRLVVDGSFFSAFSASDNFLGSTSRTLGIEAAARNQFGNAHRRRWGKRGH